MAAKGEPKRRVKLSNPRGDTGKISNNIEPIRGNLIEHIYISEIFLVNLRYGILGNKSDSARLILIIICIFQRDILKLKSYKLNQFFAWE